MGWGRVEERGEKEAPAVREVKGEDQSRREG